MNFATRAPGKMNFATSDFGAPCFLPTGPWAPTDNQLTNQEEHTTFRPKIWGEKIETAVCGAVRRAQCAHFGAL